MSKKRFRCWIGLHDWQRIEESKYDRTSCWLDDGYGCDHPLWDKVCIAPGCRATSFVATKRRAREKRAEELVKERENLAKLKLELIKDEKA